MRTFAFLAVVEVLVAVVTNNAVYAMCGVVFAVLAIGGME